MDQLKNNRIRKAFVLGASGYLGSHLVDELIKRGINTSVLVHKSPIKEQNQQVKAVRGSLDEFDWKRLENDLPDIIFHSARMSGNNKKTRSKQAIRNAESNQRLIKWLKTLATPPLLVYVSGTLVYGSHGNAQVDESVKPDPISFQREYFKAEKPILNSQNSGELPVVIVRPSWILGQGSWFKAFYLDYMKRKAKVPLYGKGENFMAFIHASDCAAMMVHAATYGTPGSILNLYSYPAITQHEFASIISMQTRLPIQKIPLSWLRFRFDKAVSEALSFNLKLSTNHQELWEKYQPYYPTIETCIGKVLN
ncbi:MAG: NAD(P)-dependent oxidoreductase [Bacteroidales bacterium]|nr:NAD(P)-dependent oxidoreductase [Bacteroidales bacterium]